MWKYYTNTGNLKTTPYRGIFTWATLPKTANIGDIAVIDGDTWGPFSINGLLLQYTNADTTQPWAAVGTGTWYFNRRNGQDITTTWEEVTSVSWPVAITIRLRVSGAVSGEDNSLYVGFGTTSAGHDLMAVNGAGNSATYYAIPDTINASDTSFAASSALHLTQLPFDSTNYLNYSEWAIRVTKLAGQV